MDFQRFRSAPGIGIGMLGLVTVVAGYPWAVEVARNPDKLIPVALVIAVLLLIAVAAQWRLGRSRKETIHLILAAALAVVAAVGKVHVVLLLIPALAFFALAWLCWSSLSTTPIIEQMALLLQPMAPRFIAPYCRACTIAWALLFVGFGGAQASLAIFGEYEAWQFFSRKVGPCTILGFVIVEFFVRKIYFRYYEDRFIDRVLSRIFPAQRTEMGRRSQSYIEHVEAGGIPDRQQACSR